MDDRTARAIALSQILYSLLTKAQAERAEMHRDDIGTARAKRTAPAHSLTNSTEGLWAVIMFGGRTKARCCRSNRCPSANNLKMNDDENNDSV